MSLFNNKLFKQYLFILRKDASGAVPTEFTDTPYINNTPSSIPAKKQRIIVFRKPSLSTNGIFLYEKSTANPQKPSGDKSFFNAFNIPMAELDKSSNATSQGVQAYYVDSKSKVDFLVTPSVSGCTLAIFEYDAGFCLCRIRPAYSTPIQINGQQTNARAEGLVRLVASGDIVVTNPPFSLFREYLTQLNEFEKSF